jgi:putative sigma-54 modulation protein
MKVRVTARHAKFTKRVKKTAEDKAMHLEHFFDHLKQIEVVLDVAGPAKYQVEMIASGIHDHVLVCHSVDDTAMAALDTVIDKMERQLVKYKEKLQGHKHDGAKKANLRHDKLKSRMSSGGKADSWW